MANILVIDDDNSVCMGLGIALSSSGHAVEMERDGLSAIQKGIRFRPDVVLVDWLLSGELNGIEVAEAIRAVSPGTNAILITGFASSDIRQSALRGKFFGYFEKPLDHEKTLGAIEKSIDTNVPPNENVAAIEFNAQGKIVHANDHAREFLSVKDDEALESIAQAFTYRSKVFIEAATDEWFPLSIPDNVKNLSLQGFVTRGGSRHSSDVLFMLEKREIGIKKSPLIQSLTGAFEKEAPNCPLPIQGHVLVCDKDNLQRGLASTQIRMTGSLFHSVESTDGVKRAIANDSQLDVLLIDYETVGPDLQSIVDDAKETRPSATVIGISSGFRRNEFEEAGVEHFLLKPVLATALKDLLAEA
ncbi:MAG: response regulator [Planctomycetota bacterium]